MPTTLRRIQVTESPAVERALAIAEREWPGLPRAELVSRLLAAGAETLRTSREERSTARRAALEHSRGSLAEAYPAGYLSELRQDWPE